MTKENLPNLTKKPVLKRKQRLFIEEYIRQMGHITSACKEVSISRETYYAWLKIPVFKAAFDDAIETHNDAVFQRILGLALQSDKDMLKLWAKTQMKHRGFIEKQEVEHSGNINRKDDIELLRLIDTLPAEIREQLMKL